MDVNNVFLNGIIEEEVCIKQPQVFEVHEKESRICKLKKALCGLKQEPGSWYYRIDGCLTRIGFFKSDVDPNLYLKVENNEPVIFLLYVDDLFLIGVEHLII